MVMEELLRTAVEKKASDVHVTTGAPPVVRVNGVLLHLEYEQLTPQVIEDLLSQITTETQRNHFRNRGELDFAFAIPNLARFRVNVFRQMGSFAMVIRLIAEKVPTLEELGHPEILWQLARKMRGLVLVTGPTGSGKSTTLAAMIDLINNERSCHIITLEDPVEFVHKHRRSIVNQREIHTDATSFAIALRSALREDPDVILVGEMRDLETIETAITAAETGHLVFATVHTIDAAQTINRIIDVFPVFQQQQIRTQLSITLQGIISQQLLARSDKPGRVAAFETLVATTAIRNLIREGKTHLIPSSIQTGFKDGMQLMDTSLGALYGKGIISYNDAFAHANDIDMLTRLITQKQEAYLG